MGAGRWTVAHGALLGSAPNPSEQEAAAVRTIDSLLGAKRRDEHRLTPAPRGGVILINAALAARWKLVVPDGPRWRRIR